MYKSQLRKHLQRRPPHFCPSKVRSFWGTRANGGGTHPSRSVECPRQFDVADFTRGYFDHRAGMDPARSPASAIARPASLTGYGVLLGSTGRSEHLRRHFPQTGASQMQRFVSACLRAAFIWCQSGRQAGCTQHRHRAASGYIWACKYKLDVS